MLFLFGDKFGRPKLHFYVPNFLPTLFAGETFCNGLRTLVMYDWDSQCCITRVLGP